MKSPRRAWRMAVVAAGFAVLFALAGMRAAQLTVTEAGFIEDQLGDQFRTRVTFRGQRGRIYDRHGEELAISIQADSLFLRRSQDDEPLSTQQVKDLAGVLDKDVRDLRQNLSSSSRFFWLGRKLSPEITARLREMDLPWVDRDGTGLGVVKEPRRYYPNRELAGQLLGFVGLDGEGLEGLEKSLDENLTGREYTVELGRDARGRRLRFEGSGTYDDYQGADVYLTLDRSIQYFADTALAEAGERFHARSATAVVMQPDTGEVLAMSVWPPFNPNRFEDYRPHEWKNRAAVDGYEPGSTFKALVAAAGLHYGEFDESSEIYCEKGSIRILDKTIHDHKPYEDLTFTEIFKYSSNIGAAKIVEQVGAENYYTLLKEFGFGERIGLDFPGEINGRLRHYSKWYPIDLANLGFGQGLLATPLQIATAFAAIGADGILHRPYVVDEVVSAAGETVMQRTTGGGKRVLEASVARRLVAIFETVTQEGGTGTNAAVAGYRVAGKTGTAQKFNPQTGEYEKRYTASFVGLVPAEDPQLVISVMVDEPDPEIGFYGGTVAAPAFRQIAERSLALLGIAPPARTQAGALHAEWKPRPASFVPGGDSQPGTGIMPDCRGKSLAQIIELVRRLDLQPLLLGSGVVVDQDPPPGIWLEPGARPRIRFSMEGP